MSANENYTYVWASEIVREYERAALDVGMQTKNRNLIMVQWKSPLAAMNMALDSAEFSIKAGPIPEQEKPTDSISSALTQEEDRGASAKGAWGEATIGGCDIFPDAGGEDKAKAWAKAFVDPLKKAGGLNLEWEGASLKVDYLQKFLDKEGFKLPYSSREFSSASDYAKECWSCTLKLDFAWQIQPINFLSEVDSLLNQIEDISDWMIDRADPTRALSWICQFDWMEKLLCPSSLASLLTMLSMLLMKYQMDSFSISIDWTSIVGPLIKAIMDAIAKIVESILALAKMPLDCLAGVLKTIDEVMDSGMELVNSAYSFGNYISSDRNPIGGAIAQAKGNQSPDAFTYRVEEEKNLYTSSSEVWGDLVPDWKPLEGDKKGKNYPQQKKTDVTTGYTVSGNSILSEEASKGVFKNPDFKGLDIAILALQESRQWLEELANNLIVGLKSLGKIFGGGLGISVQRSGLIMVVMDLIAMIRAIIQLSREGCPDGVGESRAMQWTEEGVKLLLGLMPNSGMSVHHLGGMGSGSGSFSLEAGDGMFKRDIIITKCSPVIDKGMERVFQDLRNL